MQQALGSIPSTVSSRHSVAHLFPSTGEVWAEGAEIQSLLVVQQLEASSGCICLSQVGRGCKKNNVILWAEKGAVRV